MKKMIDELRNIPPHQVEDMRNKIADILEEMSKAPPAPKAPARKRAARKKAA